MDPHLGAAGDAAISTGGVVFYSDELESMSVLGRGAPLVCGPPGDVIARHRPGDHVM